MAPTLAVTRHSTEPSPHPIPSPPWPSQSTLIPYPLSSNNATRSPHPTRSSSSNASGCARSVRACSATTTHSMRRTRGSSTTTTGRRASYKDLSRPTRARAECRRRMRCICCLRMGRGNTRMPLMLEDRKARVVNPLSGAPLRLLQHLQHRQPQRPLLPPQSFTQNLHHPLFLLLQGAAKSLSVAVVSCGALDPPSPATVTPAPAPPNPAHPANPANPTPRTPAPLR